MSSRTYAIKTALLWIRSDLRLSDNTALHFALEQYELVIPVYIFDRADFEASQMGARQVAMLLACLESLQKNLRVIGSDLVIRHGNPLDELQTLARETGTSAIFCNAEHEPHHCKRDEHISAILKERNLKWHCFEDTSIHAPNEILKENATPYVVFTPYFKMWQTRTKTECWPKPKNIRPIPSNVRRGQLPSLTYFNHQLDIPLPPCGEKAAHEALKTFCAQGLSKYSTQRDFPVIETGTSRLSHHLRFGTISARTIFHKIQQTSSLKPDLSRDAKIFTSELAWRDFYRAILWHFPQVAKECFRAEYNNIEWSKNESHFEAWCKGRTGFPIVDTAMRQLNQTGWMHNRLRMIVASFLTKDLLINWQWGERYFMEKLFDADLAANNGGWQWSAGTGTDAQPYFRIFNPMSQAAKFDPEGLFIKEYVPEAETFKYTAPIVNHSEQRVKALAMYKKAKEKG